MKKVLKITANVLVWIVLILALLITILVFSSGRNNGIANLLGYIPMTVESDSMLPTFKKDDLILCKEVDDVYSLKEGDVITFWTIIITRGDNNSIDDDIPTYTGDIIGKWTNVKISGFGKVMNFLRTKTGFFVCIVIPMAVFFLVELYKFIVTLIEVKKPELTEEDEEEIKKRAIEEYLASQKDSKEANEGAES